MRYEDAVTYQTLTRISCRKQCKVRAILDEQEGKALLAETKEVFECVDLHTINQIVR